MTEVQRIGELLRQAFEDRPWTGPSVSGILSGLTASQAAQRPLPGGHTIWELVLHIAAWDRIVCRRIAGEQLLDVPDEMDWPPVTDTSEAAWKKTVEDLERGHQQLRQAIATLSDDRLGDRAPGVRRPYSIYEMLHGIIQHDLYHAGQIAILKKGTQ
jgi:uncharacterized damage-inducible protein DinB